jgi:hypothetical protein
MQLFLNNKNYPVLNCQIILTVYKQITACKLHKYILKNKTHARRNCQFDELNEAFLFNILNFQIFHHSNYH